MSGYIYPAKFSETVPEPKLGIEAGYPAGTGYLVGS